MLRNIIQTIFTKGFIAGINLLILIVSSKYLGINTRGEISIFILNISIIQIINEIYTGFSLVYFVPKFDLKKLFVHGLTWTVLATSASNAVFFLLGKEIPGFEWDLLFLSALVITNTFNLVIILGKENIRLFNFLSVLQPFLLLCGIAYFTLVLNDFTFRAYVIPMYISFSLSFIISFIRVLKYIPFSAPAAEFSARPIFRNGFFCQLSVLFHILSNKYSFYILSSSALVGLYSTATTLIEQSVLLIANATTPIVLSKISNTGDTGTNRANTLTLAKTSLILSCLATGLVWCIPNQLFIRVLTVDFSTVKEVMLWIAPGILCVSFSTIISHYFSGIGNLKIIALCNFCGFLLTVTLAPVLISKYDLPGAAITANLSYGVSALGLFIAFLVKTRLSFFRIFNFSEDIKNLKNMF